MSVEISSNIAQVTASLRARAVGYQNISEALEKAAALTVSTVKARFTNNDWAANAASTIRRKGSSRPGINTGRLRQSITASDETDTSIEVGTNLAYGAYLQFGAQPFAVHARSRLNASLGAAGVKRETGKMNPGFPPRPYLYFDDALRAKILKIFQRTVVPTALPTAGDIEG